MYGQTKVRIVLTPGHLTKLNSLRMDGGVAAQHASGVAMTETSAGRFANLTSVMIEMYTIDAPEYAYVERSRGSGMITDF